MQASHRREKTNASVFSLFTSICIWYLVMPMLFVYMEGSFRRRSGSDVGMDVISRERRRWGTTKLSI